MHAYFARWTAPRTNRQESTQLIEEGLRVLVPGEWYGIGIQKTPLMQLAQTKEGAVTTSNTDSRKHAKTSRSIHPFAPVAAEGRF